MHRLKHEALALFRNSDSFDTLMKTAVLFSLRLLGAVFGFMLVVILTRSMSVGDLGFTLRLLSVTLFVGAFSILNADIGAVRHMLQPLIRGEMAVAAGFIHFTRRIFYHTMPFALCFFLLIALAPEYLAGRMTAERLSATFLAALTIPVLGYTKLSGAWGYARQKIVTINFFGQFARNFLVTSILAVIFFQGRVISVDAFFALHLVAAIATLLGQELSIKRALAPVKDVSPVVENGRHLLLTGIYLLAASLPYDYLQNVALAVAAFTMNERDVGLLAIVLRFLPLLLIGIFALNAAADPKIAAAFAGNDKRTALSHIRFSNLVKVGPTLVITGVIWIFASRIMEIFGPGFVEAADALRLVAVLPCMTVFFGPSVLILNAAGKHKAIFIRSVVCSFLILILVVVLGGLYGVVGATLGAVIGVAVWEFLLFRQVRRSVGINASLPATLWHIANRPEC